ncbi:MAG: hypothetical protein PHD13_02675 [Methanocellales archaeon]|nr:hypothetical protein [Methanocellales archaeon]MDD3291714.1 hypothetical protein [Methanocellales archaeon]MDD5235064.1 hypothetical protein [Methanocellales archaeon]MDD5485202.1 hypothetical protein [Methanocellales archaeon]
MNELLQFLLRVLWFLAVLGSMFKAFSMGRLLLSINADKEMKLPKSISNRIYGLIVILGLIISADLSINGLTLRSYILLIIAVFFGLFSISDFFNRQFLYNITVIFPLSAFLGHWTGLLAAQVESPAYLELAIITIPFILPYTQYKLIFRKEKLAEYISEYIQYIQNQSFQTQEIKKFTNQLKEFIHLYREYLSSSSELKSLEKNLYLKVLLQPKKTSIFNNKKYDELKRKIKIFDILLSAYTEISSVLSGVLSGGTFVGSSGEESILIAIGHFNDYLFYPHKKHSKFNIYSEFTKGKSTILERLCVNYYLMFYLTYVSNSDNYPTYLENCRKCLQRRKLAFNERRKFIPATESHKKFIEKPIDKLDDIENKIKEENKN